MRGKDDLRFNFTGNVKVIQLNCVDNLKITPSSAYILAKGKKFKAGGLPDYNTADKTGVLSWVSATIQSICDLWLISMPIMSVI
jgi:hypothetical protein